MHVCMPHTYMDACIHTCMHVIYVCMYVCMYVSIYLSMFSHTHTQQVWIHDGVSARSQMAPEIAAMDYDGDGALNAQDLPALELLTAAQRQDLFVMRFSWAVLLRARDCFRRSGVAVGAVLESDGAAPADVKPAFSSQGGAVEGWGGGGEGEEVTMDEFVEMLVCVPMCSHWVLPCVHAFSLGSAICASVLDV